MVQNTPQHKNLIQFTISSFIFFMLVSIFDWFKNTDRQFAKSCRIQTQITRKMKKKNFKMKKKNENISALFT